MELCAAVLSAAVYIFYSPEAATIEPDSASESTVFGTVLYYKAAEIWPPSGDKASGSINRAQYSNTYQFNLGIWPLHIRTLLSSL